MSDTPKQVDRMEFVVQQDRGETMNCTVRFTSGEEQTEYDISALLSSKGKPIGYSERLGQFYQGVKALLAELSLVEIQEKPLCPTCTAVLGVPGEQKATMSYIDTGVFTVHAEHGCSLVLGLRYVDRATLEALVAENRGFLVSDEDVSEHALDELLRDLPEHLAHCASDGRVHLVMGPMH